MAQFRLRVKRFAKTNCLQGPNSLQFVEGVNQLTFENDRRFTGANIISGYVEKVPKNCVRDLLCLGTQTYVSGPLREGDNVSADFKGLGICIRGGYDVCVCVRVCVFVFMFVCSRLTTYHIM